MVVPHRRLGTNYRFRRQGSNNPRRTNSPTGRYKRNVKTFRGTTAIGVHARMLLQEPQHMFHIHIHSFIIDAT